MSVLALRRQITTGLESCGSIAQAAATRRHSQHGFSSSAGSAHYPVAISRPEGWRSSVTGSREGCDDRVAPITVCYTRIWAPS